MSKQTIIGAKKDFRSAFNVPLDGQPVACKIANIYIFNHLSTLEKTILLFGKYDVILCYQKGENQSASSYDTVVISRTFCENISVKEIGIRNILPETIEVRSYFSRPLRARAGEGKPVNLKFFDQMKSVVSDAKWIGVQVEGEIAVELTRIQGFVKCPVTVPVAIPVKDGTGDKAVGVREQSNQVIDRQEARAGDFAEERKKAIQGDVERDAAGTSGKKEKNPQFKTQENLVTIDLETLAAMIVKIVRNQEEEKENCRRVPNKVLENMEVKKDALREAPSAKTEKTWVRANYTSPQAAIKAAQKTTYSLPLEKIPSRPGLHETFLQSAPPSKPADYALQAQIPGSSALHENYMKYPPPKPLGKGG